MLPVTLPSNTIWNLNAGTYVLSNAISIQGSCAGIIGNGQALLASNTSLQNLINISSTASQIIIEGIALNGRYQQSTDRAEYGVQSFGKDVTFSG